MRDGRQGRGTPESREPVSSGDTQPHVPLLDALGRPESGATAARSPMARLAANTMPLAASQLVSNLLLLVSVILVARILGPEAYGLFAIGLAIYGFSVWIGDAGLGMWGIRVIGDDPDRWSTISRLAAARAIAVAVALMVGLAAVVLLPLPPGASGPALVMVATIVPAGFSLEYVLIGLERNGLVAILRILVSAIVLASSPVLAGTVGAVGASIGYFTATTVSCIASWVLVTRVVGHPRLRRPNGILETLRRSFPMGVNSVIGQFYKQSDSVLTGVILGASAAGIYAAPVRLLTAVSTLGWVIGASLLPIYRSLDVDGNERSSALATNAMRLLVLGCLPAIGVGIGGAQAIVEALFGRAFAGSAPILAIGAVGVGLSLCMSPIGYTILARRQDHRYAAATVLSAVVAIPLIVIMAVSTRDPSGVAVAMLVAELVSAVILLIGARRSGLRLGRLRDAIALAVLIALVGGLATRFIPGGIGVVVLIGVLVEIPFGAGFAREIVADRRRRADATAAALPSPDGLPSRGPSGPDGRPLAGGLEPPADDRVDRSAPPDTA